METRRLRFGKYIFGNWSIHLKLCGNLKILLVVPFPKAVVVTMLPARSRRLNPFSSTANPSQLVITGDRTRFKLRDRLLTSPGAGASTIFQKCSIQLLMWWNLMLFMYTFKIYMLNLCKRIFWKMQSRNTCMRSVYLAFTSIHKKIIHDIRK